ncbi:MAG: hypothetical protein B7Y05_14985 [Polynucleobacter sp. 24-46-87]|nr:MAG: hypothetical protein B7Y05_14985 [Polynucleobacter sp. 24-46-87]
MSALAQLKLTDARKPHQVPQVVQRRNKLAKRVWQQIELAKAQEQGTQFRIAKFKSYTDSETGLRKQVEQHITVKPWWFTTQTGKLAISVRYGSRVLELARGKYAVEVAQAKDLTATLDAIKTAVLAGELDSAIDAAATKLRAGFVK